MKPYTTIAVAILTLAGLAHLLRLVTGFSVVVAGQPIPGWASAIGAVAALGVAWMVRKEAQGQS